MLEQGSTWSLDAATRAPAPPMLCPASRMSETLYPSPVLPLASWAERSASRMSAVCRRAAWQGKVNAAQRSTACTAGHGLVVDAATDKRLLA